MKKRGPIESPCLAHDGPRRELKESLMLGDHGVSAIPLDTSSLNQLAQLDQIVRRRNGNKMISAHTQDTRHFGRIAPAVNRQDEIHAVVEKWQSAIGIRYDPGSIGEAARRTVDCGSREIDPDAGTNPGQRSQSVA